MRALQDDPSEFLSRLLPYVDSDGARNLYAISRELSIPYQTLRHRMMRLKEQGITITPITDTEKLGLERVRVSFKLQPSAKDVRALFGGLHQSAGLRSYSRSMNNHLFDCEFTIPRGSVEELRRLLRKLEEMKLIQNVESMKLVWKDILMLKTRFYDYSRNEWDVDFSTLTGDPASINVPETSDNAPAPFDYTDLLMIKELQMDAWIKTVEIAKKIGMHSPDAAYHLNRHVFGRKLIKSFRLRWNGTKEAWLKHSIIVATYIFKEISDESTRHAMSVITSTPFTWSHMAGEDGTYMAEVAFPVSKFSENVQYISNQLRILDLTPEILLKDWSCSSTYTIPYMLYDKERSAWNFDADNAIEYALHMIKTYG
ncbi:MAG: hypothetical protein ACYC7D_15255 [Nitrososphaerales archaeon]